MVRVSAERRLRNGEDVTRLDVWPRSDASSVERTFQYEPARQRRVQRGAQNVGR